MKVNILYALMVRGVFSLALLIASSSVTHAAQWDLGRLYLGLGVMQSDSDINQQNAKALNGVSVQSSLSNDGFGMNLYVGLKLDERLSLELGLVDMGSVQVDDNAVVQKLFSIETLYLDAVLAQRVSDSVNSFIKLGVADWMLYDANYGSIADGMGLHYGVGFDIDLYGGKERVLRVLWEHQQYDGRYLSGTDSISASLMFNF